MMLEATSPACAGRHDGGSPPQRRFRWQRTTWGSSVAEFLGTFVILALGDGAVAMVVAALNQSGRGKVAFASQADWLIIAWGWGWPWPSRCGWPAGSAARTSIRPSPSPRRCGAASRGRRCLLLAGPAPRRLCRRRARLLQLSRGDRQPRPRPEHLARQRQSIPTYSIFATFPAPYFHSWFGPVLRSGDRHGVPGGFIFAVTDEFNAPVKGNLAPFIVGLSCWPSASPSAPTPATPSTRRATSARACWPGSQGWKSIAFPGNYGNVNTLLLDTDRRPLVGAAIAAPIYDFAIRDVLIVRGVKPDPEVAEDGRTAIEEPRKEIDGQVHRRNRSGHDELALHPVRPRRNGRARRSARARADHPEGRLGRARRQGDLDAHA